MQASAEPEASAPEWALLVEVPAPECSLHNCKLEELTSRPLCLQNDGVLVDVHADCHRVAFNQAFSREHACRGMHAGASGCFSGWPKLGLKACMPLHKQGGNDQLPHESLACSMQSLAWTVPIGQRPCTGTCSGQGTALPKGLWQHGLAR